MTHFLWDQASDSEEVVTPLMLDGTYLSRNSATLGPMIRQPPCDLTFIKAFPKLLTADTIQHLNFYAALELKMDDIPIALEPNYEILHCRRDRNKQDDMQKDSIVAPKKLQMPNSQS